MLFTIRRLHNRRVSPLRRLQFLEDCTPKEVVLTLSAKGLRSFVKTAIVKGYLKRGEEPAQALPGIILNGIGDWPAKVVATSRRCRSRTKKLKYATRSKPGFLAKKEGVKR